MRLLFSRQAISTGIARVAREINNDFFLEELVLVGVLKGCIPFMADLAMSLTSPCSMEYISASSYGDGTSPGLLQIDWKSTASLKGKNVVVVDDIIDTGQTLNGVVDLLLKEKPKRIATCVLINKLPRREVPVQPTYRCLELPHDAFVIGYGLDNKGYMRNFQDIFAL